MTDPLSIYCKGRSRLVAVLLLSLLLPSGCARLRPARVPMRTLLVAPARGGSHMLIVLLPGRRDRPEDFVRYGFAELAARAGVKAEMIAVDAPLSYYYKKTILERLREDVIAPARARGVERIWIAGISVGGTGAMLYAAEHPEDLAGIVTLAPYLGEDDLAREVAAAGGLRQWTPAPGPAPDLQRLWVWLRGYAESAGSENRPPLYLGYGRSDPFAPANALVGEVLPPDRVFTAPGGHGWKAWRPLWEDFLRTGVLREP